MVSPPFPITARLGDGLEHLAHDVDAALACLLECLCEHVVAEAVDLDIHLGGGDAVLGAGNLEVHVAEVILVAEDVGEDGVAVVGTFSVGDEAHCNTCHGLLDLHTCVHEGEAAAAYGGHGRRTVGFEDIGNHADCVGILGSEGNYGLEGAHREVAMADFAASGSADGLGLTGSERREVVVQHELLVFLDQDLVHLLHIHLGAEGDGRERLCLTAGEDGGTVCAGQIVDLAPDRTHLVAGTAVEALAFVEDKVAHGFLLHLVIVALDDGSLLLEFLFGNRCEEFFLDGLEACLALLLGFGGLGKLVALVVAGLLHCGLESLVLNIVRIVALGAVGAEFVHEFLLHAAMLLDFFVGDLDSLEHVCLGHFLHLAFHHHDIFFGSGYHEFNVGICHLAEVRVDYPLPVDAAHADLGDRASKGEIAGCEGAGCGEPCKSIGLHVLLGRNQIDIYKNLIVEICRPEGTDGTVHQAGDEHLIVRGLAFSLQKTSGETSCGVILLAVVYREGKEIRSFLDFVCCSHGGKQHGATHLHDCGAGRLLGEFAGLDLDYPTVGQCDCFLDYVHYFFIASCLRLLKEIRPTVACDRILFFVTGLSTETKFLDDAAVPFDVNLLEVVEELTAFAYQTEKAATGNHVLLVCLHVLGEVCDTVGEQCDLALRRTCIGVGLSVLCENFLLFRRL